MHVESWELEAYWGNRQESAEACAARFARMAVRLAAVDPVFAKWSKEPRSQAMARAMIYEPLCKMPPDVEELTGVFDASRVYKEAPPNLLWPELAFRLHPSNGLKPPYHLNATLGVGCYDFKNGPANQVKMSLSTLRLATDRPWTGSELTPVVRAIVETWEADYAVVASSRFHNIIPTHRNSFGIIKPIWPWAGWLTYLASPFSVITAPSADIKTERLPNGGMLATLCDEPFDVDNPRHLELAREMHEALFPAQKIWDRMKM